MTSDVQVDLLQLRKQTHHASFHSYSFPQSETILCQGNEDEHWNAGIKFDLDVKHFIQRTPSCLSVHLLCAGNCQQ
jgi:hypothetical protein